ncbi:MAG: hypothetical protein ABI339_08065 [Solirubrobacteraceae bacterium]
MRTAVALGALPECLPDVVELCGENPQPFVLLLLALLVRHGQECLLLTGQTFNVGKRLYSGRDLR